MPSGDKIMHYTRLFVSSLQFVAPLPEDYEEFKELVKISLPKIVDTKLMATTSPLKEDILSSVLEDLVKTMDQAPFKLPKITSGIDHPGYSLGTTEKYHEAGYDAFITGEYIDDILISPFYVEK